MQIIYYKNLHDSPHYSVTLNEYCDMIEYAQRIHIRSTIFEPGTNYFSPKKCNVMVMNNFKYEKDLVGYMKQQPTKLFMLKKTSIDKKRNVRARHVSPSSSIANAWTKTMVGTSIVSKPGFSDQIPAEHKIGLARALNFLGYTLKEIMKHYNVCVFNDDARNIQFSKELQKNLNSSNPVYFEGGTIPYLEKQLNMHVDSLNDGTPGYEWSGVLAFADNDGRLTFNGYNRKLAHDYMIRLENTRIF